MSVVLLPKYSINGLDADEESTRLHFKKNQPEQPDVDFPPYAFYPYPTCVYREWSEADRQREVFRTAGRMLLKLSDPVDLATAEAAVSEYESRLIGRDDRDEHGGVNVMLRAQNDRELTQAHEDGWANTPQGVKAAIDRRNKAIALAAAHRQYEDRNLTGLAAAERDAVDEASDDHVLEIVAPKKKPGRPAKAKEIV